MNKSQRMWIVFASVTLLVFALLLCAYAGISFLVANYSDIATAYPFLQDIANIFAIDASFLAVGFLAGYELVVALAIPAIVLIVCASLGFSPFKGGKAKYLVAMILGLLVSSGVAYWLLASLNDIFKDQVLVYLAVVLFPIFVLAFCVLAIAFRTKQKQVEQTETQTVSSEQTEQTPATQSQQTEQEQLQTDQQPPVVEDKNPYYTRKPETVAEIVARTYGGVDNSVDEAKRKKLEKVQQMFDLGAIDRYEYQQLTIRILSDK